MLIDRQTDGPGAGEAFSIPDNVVNHIVSDRAAALRILKSDFQHTADGTWANVILTRFIAGENYIEMPNGNNFVFIVRYSED
jgi:hypothetical protein